MLIAKNKPMKGHSVCSMLTKNNVIVLMYVDKKAIVQNSESSTKKNRTLSNIILAHQLKL